MKLRRLVQVGSLAALGALSVGAAPVSVASPQVAPAARSSARVLVFYNEDRYDYPGLARTDGALREKFQAELGDSVEIYSESLDLVQFERPAYDSLLADFYRRKYAGKTPDLLVAVLEQPLDFLLRHADVMFPGVPIVFGGVDAATVESKTLPPNVTGVLIKREYAPTLDIVLRLQPETRNVFVVGGSSAFDQSLETLVRRDLAPLEGRVGINYRFGFTLDQWLTEMSSLPAQSVILYVTVTADGAGRPFVPREVVSAIAAVANAPVYVFLDQYVGMGAVGGSVYSYGAQGTQVAELGLQVIRGAAPSSLPIRQLGALVDMFDARELRRWNLDEARLPPGSTVLYREPSVWELYRWYIVASLALVVIEGALIAGLLLARAKQHRAETDIRKLYVRLANVEDDERRALHAELHDQVGANLSALRLELDVAAGLLSRHDGAGAERHLGHAREVAGETIVIARDLMAELRPPALDDLGLVAALRTFAESQSLRLNLPIDVSEPDLVRRPGPLVEGALFRIAQEAVINAARHASATRVTIGVVERHGRLILTVEDNGVGFDPHGPRAGPDHWGLKNMRERAVAIGGQLRVEAAPGAGTRVIAEAPQEAV